MKIILLCFMLFLISCDNIKDLPDNINMTEHVDYSARPDDNGAAIPQCSGGFLRYGDACVKSALAVVATEGYDYPEAGHLYLAESEDMPALAQIQLSRKLGSAKSSDFNLSSELDRLMIIERNGTDSVTVIMNDGSDRRISPAAADFANFQDAAYNPLDSRLVVSALQLDYLVLSGDNSAYEKAPLGSISAGTDAAVSPSKMRKIGNRLFVTSQMLGKDWISRGGALAVLNLDDYSVSGISLPLNNPISSVGYNPNYNRDLVFVNCAGSFREKNGGLVEVNITDGSSRVIFKESTKAGNLLYIKVGDLTVTNSGEIFFIGMDINWKSNIYRLDTHGDITVFAEDVNGFAATAIDYSPVTGSLYYFMNPIVNGKVETDIVKHNPLTGVVEKSRISYGPAAIKIWLKQ